MSVYLQVLCEWYVDGEMVGLCLSVSEVCWVMQALGFGF